MNEKKEEEERKWSLKPECNMVVFFSWLTYFLSIWWINLTNIDFPFLLALLHFMWMYLCVCCMRESVDFIFQIFWSNFYTNTKWCVSFCIKCALSGLRLMKFVQWHLMLCQQHRTYGVNFSRSALYSPDVQIQVHTKWWQSDDSLFPQ